MFMKFRRSAIIQEHHSIYKVYLSHLDVASPRGFILHVDYYFVSFWFILICYVVKLFLLLMLLG